jgi:hypothetical protein
MTNRIIKGLKLRFSDLPPLGLSGFSWRIWLALIPSRVIFMSSRFTPSEDVTIWQVLLGSMLANIISAAPLLIGAFLAWTFAKKEWHYLAIALLCWSISDAVYTAAAIELVGFENLNDPRMLQPLFFLSHAMGTLLLGSTLIYGVGLYRNSRQQILASSESMLNHEDLLRRADDYVAALSKRFSDEITKNVEPGLMRIKREVEEIKQSNAQSLDFEKFAKRVRSFSSAKVRSLSHRISENRTEIKLPSSAEISKKSTFRNKVSRLQITPPTPLLTVAMFVCFDLFMRPNKHFFTFIATGMVAFTFLFAMNKLFLFATNRARGLVILITVCSHLALPPMLVWLRLSLGEHVNAWSFTIGSLLGSLLISFFQASYRANRETAADLAAADAALTALTEKIRNEAEALRESFWQVLHGKIQGRLALVSLTLSELATLPTSQKKSQTLINRLQTLLDGIELDLQDLKNHKGGSADLASMVLDLAKEWKGLLKINTFIAEQAGVSIQGSTSIQRKLVQLVEEAILNARIHGGANEVWVEITKAATRNPFIRLKVIDNGRGFEDPITSGLGTSYVAAVSDSWSLTRNESEKTVLSAQIGLVS